MRPGEYLALPKSNLFEAEVKVDRAVERSGHRISVTKTPAGWRWIDLSPETSELVHHYAKHHAADSPHDLVFPTASGKWQCINNWRNRAFTTVCVEAGLAEEVRKNGKTIIKPKYSPYDLRHFYASMLIDPEGQSKAHSEAHGPSEHNHDAQCIWPSHRKGGGRRSRECRTIIRAIQKFLWQICGESSVTRRILRFLYLLLISRSRVRIPHRSPL